MRCRGLHRVANPAYLCRFPLHWVAACCTVLRCRWYQSGITLPTPRRSSLWSFLDTLAYPAFIDTLRRLPRSPDQAMYNPWERARVVHDVAAIQEVGVARLLAGEPGRNGDDLHPGGQRPPHPRCGVFDRQALPSLEVELARRKEVHLGGGLPVLDVV